MLARASQINKQWRSIVEAEITWRATYALIYDGSLTASAAKSAWLRAFWLRMLRRSCASLPPFLQGIDWGPTHGFRSAFVSRITKDDALLNELAAFSHLPGDYRALVRLADKYGNDRANLLLAIVTAQPKDDTSSNIWPPNAGIGHRAIQIHLSSADAPSKANSNLFKLFGKLLAHLQRRSALVSMQSSSDRGRRYFARAHSCVLPQQHRRP